MSLCLPPWLYISPFPFVLVAKKHPVFPRHSINRHTAQLCVSVHLGYIPLSLFMSHSLSLKRSGNMHTDIRHCWLVTVIPSSHFWCKWGEIKGYHLTGNALRTISFPALCTTSLCKAGFLSIRHHENRSFPSWCSHWMKHDLSPMLLFWNHNISIFFLFIGQLVILSRGKAASYCMITGII